MQTEDFIYLVPRGSNRTYFPYIFSRRGIPIEQIKPKKMIPKSNNIHDIIHSDEYNHIIYPVLIEWYTKSLNGDIESELYLRKFYWNNIKHVDCSNFMVCNVPI